jgi:hypothetical protein
MKTCIAVGFGGRIDRVLPGVDIDAQLFAESAQARGYTCQILVNEEATYTNLRTQIAESAQSDTLLLYFNCHGWEYNEALVYLGLRDGDFSIRQLYALLAPCKGTVAVVFDACDAGAMAPGTTSQKIFARTPRSRTSAHRSVPSDIPLFRLDGRWTSLEANGGPFARPRVRPEVMWALRYPVGTSAMAAPKRPVLATPPERYVALCAVAAGELARQWLQPDPATGAYGEFTRGLLRAMAGGAVSPEDLVQAAARSMMPTRHPSVQATEQTLISNPLF